ncbi:MAG: DEAD/DEAH box helicase [Ferruginibacter sp.]
MKFEEFKLNKALLNSLDDLGISNATLIQERVFPIVMSGRDVCGIAQTGTGKTFAYLLPCMQLWKFDKEKNPQILVLVPTRELVKQVVDAIESLATYLSIATVGVYGGVNINTQKLALGRGADILVATPGRLYDLLLDGAFKTKNIKKLVIDEMDEMLNLGFRTQIKNILDLLPEKRQNLLFSATITEDVTAIINEYFASPEMVEAAPTGTPLKNIEQQGYCVPNYNTKKNLLHLVLAEDSTMTKVLVFAGTKKIADDLYENLLPTYGDKLGLIHSNKEQNHRFNTVNNFKNGTCSILIATDIVARGIDVSEVTHVINFDIPDVPENYMHRIGRTGRANKKGIAITLFSEFELKQVAAIEALMDLKLPLNDLPADLTLSTELIDDEMPKIKMKSVLVKMPKKELVGPSFHEKSAKNSKTNYVVSRKDRMMAKYGKKKTRGQKPKGR